jgi:prepilin-type N-terminal cleavage/methylation domain-containing protein
MSWRRFPERTRSRVLAFTLIELLVVMVVVALVAAGLAMPLAAQVEMRRMAETRRLLEEAREALLGYAAAHGRLPCPATIASRGEESFATGGDATNGQCESFHDGFLPAATLGLGPLDHEGFLRDAWGATENRLRYAVFGADPVAGVQHALTRANGLQAASVAGLGAAPRYLLICASGAGVTAASCGAAANQLTRRAVLVIHSKGSNATRDPAPGSDEARNLDGDPVFVAGMAALDGFDDLLTWVPLPILVSRMLAAGRLP